MLRVDVLSNTPHLNENEIHPSRPNFSLAFRKMCGANVDITERFRNKWAPAKSKSIPRKTPFSSCSTNAESRRTIREFVPLLHGRNASRDEICMWGVGEYYILHHIYRNPVTFFCYSILQKAFPFCCRTKVFVCYLRVSHILNLPPTYYPISFLLPERVWPLSSDITVGVRRRDDVRKINFVARRHVRTYICEYSRRRNICGVYYVLSIVLHKCVSTLCYVICENL